MPWAAAGQEKAEAGATHWGIIPNENRCFSPFLLNFRETRRDESIGKVCVRSANKVD